MSYERFMQSRTPPSTSCEHCHASFETGQELVDHWWKAHRKTVDTEHDASRERHIWEDLDDWDPPRSIHDGPRHRPPDLGGLI